MEEFREQVRTALREVMLTQAGLDVLLEHTHIPEGPTTPKCCGCAWSCCRRARLSGLDS